MGRDKRSNCGRWIKVFSCVLLFSMGVEQAQSQEANKYDEAKSYVKAPTLYSSLNNTQNENNTEPLKKIVSVNYNDTGLEEVLKDIASKAGLTISYSEQVIPLEKNITLQLQEVTIEKALQIVLADNKLHYLATKNGHLIVGNMHYVDLRAQEVSGTVTDASSGETFAGVNVVVKGSNTGTSTDREGNYTLSVPSLQDTLVFSFIGYQQREVPINGRNNVDVTIEASTETLDEVVVTGAGMATERRKLGNTIESVDSEALDGVSVSEPMDMLSGRIPGLTAVGGGGEKGVGSAIRIRGSSSLAMNNEPMLYVDGVRVDNHSSGPGSGFQSSRMNDINPNDIDRVEVLKGASAATLYGSQANSGIIQIFTKSGRNGSPRFNFSSTYELSQSPKRFPGSYSYDPSNDEILHINSLNKNLENSYGQRYSLSVGGGSDEVQYYTSVFTNNSTGTVPDTKFQKYGGRSNISVYPTDRITLGLNLSYTRNYQNTNPSYGHPSAFVANMMLASPFLVSDQRPNGEIFTPVDDIKLVDIEQQLDNFATSASIDVNWADGIFTEFSAGYNLIDDNNEELWPFNQAFYPDGRRMTMQRNGELWTLDFNTSWETSLNENIESSFIVGAQAYFNNHSFVSNEVGDLAGRGASVLRAGATIIEADEFAEEVKNVGYFIQEQVGFWDELFVTLGIRFDASSAFGENLNTETYPKVGASYAPNMSGTDFLSTVRFRGSYGESGLQPGAFDAQRTYIPTSYLDNKPGIQPGNLGNDDLKPERSQEFELGIDLGFIDNQFNLNFTYFNQRTSDALIARQFSPSEGFLNSQLQNIAEVSSKGIELGVETRFFNNNSNASGLIRSTIATLDQKVADMGGAPPFNVGESFRAINTIAEGRQPGALIGTEVNPDDPYNINVSIGQLDDISQITANKLKDGDGTDAQVFLGNTLPTLTGNLFFDFSFKRLNLTATVTGAYGAVIWNEVDLLRNQLGLTEEVAQIQQELKDPNTSDERKRELAEKAAYLDFNVKGNWVDDGDYIRLQDLSLGYNIPSEFLNLGVDNLNMSLSAKNLFELTNYNGYGSPGTSGTDVTNTFNRNQDRFQLALPRTYEVSIQAEF